MWFAWSCITNLVAKLIAASTYYNLRDLGMCMPLQVWEVVKDTSVVPTGRLWELYESHIFKCWEFSSKYTSVHPLSFPKWGSKGEDELQLEYFKELQNFEGWTGDMLVSPAVRPGKKILIFIIFVDVLAYIANKGLETVGSILYVQCRAQRLLGRSTDYIVEEMYVDAM